MNTKIAKNVLGGMEAEVILWGIGGRVWVADTTSQFDIGEGADFAPLTVPSAALRRALPGRGDVVLTRTANTLTLTSAGGATADLTGKAARPPKNIPLGEGARLDVDTVAAAIGAAAKVATYNRHLDTVHTHVLDGVRYWIALDGHRLHRWGARTTDADRAAYTIPSAALLRAAKVGGDFLVSRDTIARPVARMTFTPPSVAFPPYQQIIPSERGGNYLQVAIPEAIAALKRLVAAKVAPHLMAGPATRWSAEGDLIRVTTATKDATATVAIPIQVGTWGDPMGYHPDYMLDALKGAASIGATICTLQVGRLSEPLVMRAAHGDTEYLALVMPARLVTR
jgi:hypothetical protein